MSQLTYHTFTSYLPQGALTGSSLKGRPRAHPVLLKDLEIKAISDGCGEGRRDTERESRRKGCIASRRAGGPPGAPESHQSHPKPLRYYLLAKAEKQEPARERMAKEVKVKRNCLALDRLGQHSRCGSAPTKLRVLTLTPGCFHGLQDAHTNPRYSPSTLPPLPSSSLTLSLPCPFSSLLDFLLLFHSLSEVAIWWAGPSPALPPKMPQGRHWMSLCYSG